MPAEVFFTQYAQKIPELFKQVEGKIKGKNVGIKLHFGEAGCETYLPPEFVKTIYEQLKKIVNQPKLIEANVLYKGERTFTASHRQVAIKHGFDFAPIDIYDEKSADDCWEIPIDKKHFKSVKIAKNLKNYDFLVVVSHFKGHLAAGFGGALKNLGMGLGSRAGKLMMHANLAPEIDPAKCIACGKCIEACPARAIELENGKAKINKKICIGCATCIVVCPQGTVGGFTSSPEQLQERIVEFCYGILKELPAVYFNFLVNITSHCDCYGKKQEKLIDDIGFLASSDPVAIDQVSCDLVKKAFGRNIFQEIHGVSGEYQLVYGEKLGLGQRKYNLIYLD